MKTYFYNVYLPGQLIAHCSSKFIFLKNLIFFLWFQYNKTTHEWEEEDLDEEMEDIFHPANDHFSLADLVERVEEAKPHFDENDFECK